jgi:hypothetical protein
MLFTTLVVITVLCLALPLTRMYGVIGSVITLYFYPQYTLTLLGVLIISGIAVQYFLRRKSHAH